MSIIYTIIIVLAIILFLYLASRLIMFFDHSPRLPYHEFIESGGKRDDFFNCGFCSGCGKRMYYAKIFNGYSTETGKPTYKAVIRCPGLCHLYD